MTLHSNDFYPIPNQTPLPPPPESLPVSVRSQEPVTEDEVTEEDTVDEPEEDTGGEDVQSSEPPESPTEEEEEHEGAMDWLFGVDKEDITGGEMEDTDSSDITGISADDDDEMFGVDDEDVLGEPTDEFGDPIAQPKKKMRKGKRTGRLPYTPPPANLGGVSGI